MSNAKPTAISDNTFHSEVLGAEQPVLVDFWAEWCGPCRTIAPMLDQLAEEFDGKLAIKKLNVDDNQQSAAEYGIRSIPTLMVFKGGKPVETIVGVQPKSALSATLARHAG